jgi:hypothetical protein
MPDDTLPPKIMAIIGMANKAVPFIPPFAIPIKYAELNNPIQLQKERLGKNRLMKMWL